MTPSAKEGSYQSQSLPGRNPKSAAVQAIALLCNVRWPTDQKPAIVPGRPARLQLHALSGQSGEAHAFPTQDENLTAELSLRQSIHHSTLRQKYRSTSKHNPQRDGSPEKGLYRLHPYPFTSPTTQATSLIQHSFSGWRQKLSKRFV